MLARFASSATALWAPCTTCRLGRTWDVAHNVTASSQNHLRRASSGAQSRTYTACIPWGAPGSTCAPWIHPECPSLRNLFSTKWVRPQPAEGISVVRIFRVEVPAEVRDKHDKYARTVRNIRRRFRGTSCSDECNFIVDPQRSPCGLRSCSLCNIGVRGFKLDENVGRTALARNFKLRYGKGVYFSSVSGKGNDYADQTAKTAKDGTKLRCMFVANVAAGKAYSTKEKARTTTNARLQSYDSVVGEVGQGLNYDELVVY